MIRWILTSGVRLFLQFWHSKTPVFTFPRGWVPWYVEWTLAFPRAPSGSVSINVWSAACAAVLKVTGDLVEYLLVMMPSQTGVKRKGEAMKIGADGKMGTSAGAARGGKKEL
jgi:tail-anchored protein insertion receptor